VRQTLLVCLAHSAWARLAWLWSVETIVVDDVTVLIRVEVVPFEPLDVPT
jgi:hypothetical protein